MGVRYNPAALVVLAEAAVFGGCVGIVKVASIASVVD
jgi:hypothetical protein